MNQTQMPSQRAETYPPHGRWASAPGESRQWVRPSLGEGRRESGRAFGGPAASFVGQERVSCPEHRVIVHPSSNGPPGQAKFMEGLPVFVWGLEAMTE